MTLRGQSFDMALGSIENSVMRLSCLSDRNHFGRRQSAVGTLVVSALT